MNLTPQQIRELIEITSDGGVPIEYTEIVTKLRDWFPEEMELLLQEVYYKEGYLFKGREFDADRVETGVWKLFFSGSGRSIYLVSQDLTAAVEFIKDGGFRVWDDCELLRQLKGKE